MKEAVVILAHGSRSPEAAEEVKALAGVLRSRSEETGIAEVREAYLEISRPDFAEAAARLAAEGVTVIRVMPHFLNSGRHVRRDIPELICEAEKRHPDVRFLLYPAIGALEAIADLYVQQMKGDHSCQH